MNITVSAPHEQIVECEMLLLGAFSNKDINLIEELLHDEALFVYPNGQTLTKAIVLDNYRSGNSSFASITSSDQVVNVIGDTAVVTMVLELTGRYYEQEISSQFRYIRVWKNYGGTWKAIAVSGVPIPKP